MKKRDSLLTETLLVSALAFLGKPLGFIREALIAAYYGATAETDAFFFAQGMPNAVFPAIGSGLALALTSLYVQKIATEGEIKGDRYASRMLSASFCLGIILGAFGIAVSPVLVPLFAPGFSGEQQKLAIGLTRLTMSVFALSVLQYMLSAVLNSKKYFAFSQIAGLFYNSSIIFIVALFGLGRSMKFLMLSVMIGMLVQVLVLVFSCRKKFVYTHGLNPFHQDTWHLFRLAFPILLGSSVVQLNNIVDRALGSTLPGGSLSALSYANSLTAFVINIFITSLSTTLYPTLTTEALADKEHFSETLLNSMENLTLILLPISYITFLDAGDIVNIVYARGSFDQTAVSYTALALAGYAPMFVCIGMREILTRAFFAVQDTKTPMQNNAIGVVCNIMCSILFVRWLGLAGIALGTTVSSIITALLLVRSACRHLLIYKIHTFFFEFGKQLLAGVVLALFLMCLHHFITPSLAIVRFFADTVLGFAIYLLVLCLLGNKQIRSIWKLFCRTYK